ncbi:MAG: SGNH/GDSL hydrolase family protein [Schwartzia sp.]|nr:SGNH/GDSL hydrolase family protein [Schwartzia sp. (in: firmicutes)]
MKGRSGLFRALSLGLALSCAACFSWEAEASSGATLTERLAEASIRQLPRSAAQDKVRLTWPMTPGAARYRVAILSAPAYAPQNVIYEETVSAPGAEIDLEVLARKGGAAFETAYWAVRPMRYGGAPLGDFSAPQPLSAGERTPVSPLPNSDYGTMAEPPIYLVYAWVPVRKTSSYEVEVWREDGSARERVRHYYTYETILYDEAPLNTPGRYTWRVRALDGYGRRWSDWSEPEAFTVNANVTVAALGDSITHGGGAVTVPPSRSMYCWESYAGLPVKNLGRSGDSSYDLLTRFEADVLPFAPKYLVVMGGVNDFRVGVSAQTTIQNFSRIAEKCSAYGITPIFATATPISPELMKQVREIETAAWNWQAERQALNAWVMAQPYAVDVAASLTDEDGDLKEELTTDGLHPDAEAKKIIGEAIGKYLRETFGLQ